MSKFDVISKLSCECGEHLVITADRDGDLQTLDCNACGLERFKKFELSEEVLHRFNLYGLQNPWVQFEMKHLKIKGSS